MPSDAEKGHKFSWANLGGSPIITQDRCSCGWEGPMNWALTPETCVGSYYDKHIDLVKSGFVEPWMKVDSEGKPIPAPLVPHP